MNNFRDSEEWQFIFNEAIKWDRLIPHYYKEFPSIDGYNNANDVKGFYHELLSTVADWCQESLEPKARLLDHEGAGIVKDGKTYPGKTLKQIYDEALALEIFSLQTAKEHGGMEVPSFIGLLGFSFLSRASVSISTQLGFFNTIADMVERFCTHEDAKRLIPQIMKGELSGSMNLTEPGAGSDVGSLRTSAVKREDGFYHITGEKIFITNGGGGVAFVLARIKGAPEGLAGISLFLVEQKIEGSEQLNFHVVKNEEKLGLHGSFTTQVVFNNSKAKLIGQENEGFKYMLHLMNEARIGVGVQCLGGIEACLSYARKYATERVQFGRPIADLPLMKRNLEDWETELDALRCLVVDTAFYFDIYQRLDLKKRHGAQFSETEEADSAWATKWLRRRTPLVKYYGAELYTLLSQRTIQVLGGYGFMQEYEAERFHRDSFAPLLYEGTSQIQALMCMKDLMKYIMKNPSHYFQTLVSGHPFGNLFTDKTKINKEFTSIQYEFKKNLLKLIIKTLMPDLDYTNPADISKFFNSKNWLAEENFEELMCHAETICQGLSYLETLRVLAEHTKISSKREDLFNRYANLVKPRMEYIYCDWRVRS